MSYVFTDEKKQEIRKNIIEIAIDLSKTIGLKKMNIETISKKAGISTGSFYTFFDSKEKLVIELINELEIHSLKKIEEYLKNQDKIPLETFIKIYRDFFKPENNFLLCLKLEDWVWLKTHIKDQDYFNNITDIEKIKNTISYIQGIKKDIDLGVVINFIKSIYSMYQNKETFFEESLETNIDMIFDTIYRYVKE